jgi:hypothetical protein
MSSNKVEVRQNKSDLWKCFWHPPYPRDKDSPPGTVDFHDLKLIASRLRIPQSLDHQFLLRLADKLDPPDPNKSRYILKHPNGRPWLISRDPDPLVTAMRTGDLKAMADHVREATLPDERVLSWVADGLDQRTPDADRIVVKLTPGRPDHKTPFKKCVDQEIAFRVERDFRRYRKLDAALYAAAQQYGLSVTTVRRKWKKYFG